jgi:hypothetical protein
MKISSFKRLGYLVLTIILCFTIYAMMQGTLQNHIHFAGVLNEIGFTFMLILLTICTASYTISE